MNPLILAILLVSADPVVKTPERPVVVFAPEAWNDPPKNREFESCKMAHPDALAPDGPETTAPVIAPAKSARAKDPGRIIAELYVDSTGKLQEIRVLRAQGKKFVEQSIEELKGASIKPGTLRGKPVAMCIATNRWTEAH